MINLNELPQDKKGKEIALNAIESQMLDLAAKISTGDLRFVNDVEFYIWSVVHEISKLKEE